MMTELESLLCSVNARIDVAQSATNTYFENEQLREFFHGKVAAYEAIKEEIEKMLKSA
jgi:hypothetical protein